MDALSGTGFLMVRGSETRGVTLFFEVPLINKNHTIIIQIDP